MIVRCDMVSWVKATRRTPVASSTLTKVIPASWQYNTDHNQISNFTIPLLIEVLFMHNG